MPRLTLHGISALRPRQRGGLLRDVSFSLPSGRCLALLGDGRAGGALLLDVVAGHVPATSGQVRLGGELAGAKPPAARDIGTVSARDPLFAHLGVRGNVSFPLLVRRVPPGERERQVGEAMALLGLERLAASRPSVLDEADRVRTQIARALVGDPALILMDDPFAALERVPRHRLQRVLRRLQRARGLTILLATGDREEAMLLGDEVGILHEGRLHQVGPVPALLDRPADQTVAERLGDASLLPGRIQRLDDEVATVRLACGHEMDAEPGEALREGMACVLCVRPDRIATAFLSRSGLEPASDSLPATLAEAVHLGDHLRLRFRLADGSELLVRRPPAAVAGPMRPDQPALLAWQPHQARVFAAPAG